jgi:hypothetical protein
MPIEMPPSDITIHIPLPQVDISEEGLQQVRSLLMSEGKTISVRAEDVYPCAESWIEVAFTATTYLGAVGLGHYASKIYVAIDMLLKPGISRIMLCLRKGNRESVVSVVRDSKQEAIDAIRQALEKLENAD